MGFSVLDESFALIKKALHNKINMRFVNTLILAMLVAMVIVSNVFYVKAVCTENSSYRYNMAECPKTCEDMNGQNCDHIDPEGCVCDEGFLRNLDQSCVEIGECNSIKFGPSNLLLPNPDSLLIGNWQTTTRSPQIATFPAITTTTTATTSPQFATFPTEAPLLCGIILF